MAQVHAESILNGGVAQEVAGGHRGIRGPPPALEQWEGVGVEDLHPRSPPGLASRPGGSLQGVRPRVDQDRARVLDPLGVELAGSWVLGPSVS